MAEPEEEEEEDGWMAGWMEMLGAPILIHLLFTASAGEEVGEWVDYRGRWSVANTGGKFPLDFSIFNSIAEPFPHETFQLDEMITLLIN